MRTWPMLMLRGSTWYYRRSIPRSLRPLMGGKRELWRSLRTTDRNEAQARSLAVGLDVERDLQALRKQAARAQTDPQLFARRYEARTLAEDARWWRNRRDLVDDGTEETTVRISEQLVTNWRRSTARRRRPLLAPTGSISSRAKCNGRWRGWICSPPT